MDFTIKIWNFNEGTLLRTINGYSADVRSLVVLQNGYLVRGANDNSIMIWDWFSGKLIKRITGPSSYVGWSLAV